MVIDSQIHGQALGYLQRGLQNSQVAFRPSQYEAIEHLVTNRNRVLVIQRTGWGKSIVYFIATRLLRDRGHGPTLLICPLIALMRNQIQMAENLGLRANMINSANKDDWADIETALDSDDVDVLLISPERLANEEFRDRVLAELAGRIGMLVIDEVHCISDWGHDFRPDYRRIARLLQHLPDDVPVLGTTATANDRVIDDVQEQIGTSTVILRGQIKRESLRLQTIRLPMQSARLAWLAEQVPQMPGSGIIYCLTVKDVHNVAAWLKHNGIDAEPYWGSADSELRIELEQRLLQNDLKVLVATTALGMGFDKPDLGFVIHFQRPGSVIHYYQQIGRAGRALPDAWAILLCGDEDEAITTYFRKTAFPPEPHIDDVLTAIRNSPGGIQRAALERSVNLSRGQIEKVLKRLLTESPAPIHRRDGQFFSTGIEYEPDRDRIDQITELRLVEQEQMREYMESDTCLMAFLERALGSINPQPCQRCASCAGSPLLIETVSSEMAVKAHTFLRKQSYEITPRRQWASPGLPEYGFTGGIHPNVRHEPGKALSRWRDSGWGEMVYAGKFQRERFPRKLVQVSAELIRDRWGPDPMPAWVTCIPSLSRPELVPDFAQRLAEELGIPFYLALQKRYATDEQKSMQNSYQQLRNIAGSFAVDSMPMPDRPVLLVDDIVDSRWTFTVAAIELRRAGSGPVIPFALTTMFGG